MDIDSRDFADRELNKHARNICDLGRAVSYYLLSGYYRNINESIKSYRQHSMRKKNESISDIVSKEVVERRASETANRMNDGIAMREQYMRRKRPINGVYF